MATDSKEHADPWILPLRGHRITSISWDDDGKVVFGVDLPAEIIVTDDAILTSGSIHAPGAEKRTLRQFGPDVIADCVGTKIASAVGFESGGLRIVLETGWHLNTPATGPCASVLVRSPDSVIWPRPDPGQPGSHAC